MKWKPKMQWYTGCDIYNNEAKNLVFAISERQICKKIGFQLTNTQSILCILEKHDLTFTYTLGIGNETFPATQLWELFFIFMHGNSVTFFIVYRISSKV